MNIKPDVTDHRERYEWITGYAPNARKEIYGETVYLFIVFFSSLFLIFATWKGWINLRFLFSSEEGTLEFKKYAFYAASGMLGGVTFGMKYFYRVVARGYWHQDRRIWRIMSPFIAMVFAFIVGVMIDANILTVQKPTAASAFISIGFLAGYFADNVAGKMYEIAKAIFGESSIRKDGDGK